MINDRTISSQWFELLEMVGVLHIVIESKGFPSPSSLYWTSRTIHEFWNKCGSPSLESFNRIYSDATSK